MNAVVSIEKELKEKVANLVHLEVPVEQIARVCTCEIEKINALLIDEEFKAILAGKTVETIEENKQFNDGWDAIEAKALRVVNTTLETTHDPDYALRAATLANKAVRRGSLGRAINGNIAATTVINLTQAFINKLEHFEPGKAQFVQQTAPKQHDCLSPSDVEKMFVVNKNVGSMDALNEDADS